MAEILADIRRDDLRASALIQRMRAQLRKSEPSAVPVDLADLVDTTLALLASEARMRKIVLRAVLPGRGLPVAADPVQLQQVMINLVLNSMDAMAGASPRRSRWRPIAGPLCLLCSRQVVRALAAERAVPLLGTNLPAR